MGMYYSADISVGYRVSEDDMMEYLAEVVNEDDFDFLEEVEKICHELECRYSTATPINNVDGLDVIFTPGMPRGCPGTGLDFGRFEVGQSYLYSDIVAMQDPLEKLYKDLIKKGIKPGTPKVHLAASVG